MPRPRSQAVLGAGPSAPLQTSEGAPFPVSNRELPMMPWYPQDFAGATSGWTVAERALYRELLDAEWILGKLPMQADRLARIARFDLETFKEAWQVVSTKFDDVSGCLVNRRLEEHRASAAAFAEQKRAAARAGGLARAQQMHSERSASAKPNGSYPSLSPSPSQDKNSVLSGEVKPSPSLGPRRSPSPERRSIRTSDPEEIERRRREAAAIAEALAAKAAL